MSYGKIRANFIEHNSAGSLNTQYVVNGSAKAWVNFNGTGTIAVRESFNTSGITDEGTGHYSTSFTNNLTNADYVVAGTAMYSSSTNAHSICYGDANGANGEQPTTSRYEVLVIFIASVGPQDCTRVQLQTLGDLA